VGSSSEHDVPASLGLFVLFASVGSALSLYPLKALGGLAILLCFGLQLFDHPADRFLDAHTPLSFGVLAAGLALMAFELDVLAWLRRLPLWRGRLHSGRRVKNACWSNTETTPIAPSASFT